MSISRTRIALAAAGGSALLLAGAFLFQLAGYPPCKMCIWQRWPHAVAIVIGLVFVLLPARGVALLGALAALSTAGVGMYHAGVEQGWWEGPSSCSSGDITNMTPQELLEQIMGAPLVRCDEIAWQLAGISMAGWNAILSLCLAILWIWAAARSN